jgi:hypothetical protein
VQGERAGVGVDRGDGGAEVQGVGERGAVGHAVHEAGVALGPGERVAVARVLEAAREVVVQSGEGRQLGGGAAVVVAAGVVDGPAQAPAGQAEVVQVAGEGDGVEVAELGAAAGDGEGEQAAAIGTAALVEGAEMVAPPGPLGGFVGGLVARRVEALVPQQADLVALGRGGDDGAGGVLGAAAGVAAEEDAEVFEEELEGAAVGVRAREVVGAERVRGAREGAAAGGAAELGLELDEVDVGAGAAQAPGGGEAGDAAADDGDLGLDVARGGRGGEAGVAQAVGDRGVGADERGGRGGRGGAGGERRGGRQAEEGAAAEAVRGDRCDGAVSGDRWAVFADRWHGQPRRPPVGVRRSSS